VLALTDCKRGRQCVARVCAADLARALRKIEHVVEVEVAHHCLVGDDRLRHRNLVALANQRGHAGTAVLAGDLAADPAWLRIEGTDRAGQGVEDQALGLADHLRRQVVVADVERCLGELACDRHERFLLMAQHGYRPGSDRAIARREP
jgi:hypothetical protein